MLTPQARFSVLTSRLIRIEYDPAGAFEDRPSQAFWYRQQPVPQFTVRRMAGQPEGVEITTEHLRLRYLPSPHGFTSQSLSIELLQTGQSWQYGQRDPLNLLGTARTLDEANGPVYLQRGLVSRSGWVLVDDSHSLVFDEQGWLQDRHTNSGVLDLYFFGYGQDYLGCLADFCRVAGPVPLVPRWVLGNWWSRYWAYSQAELVQLMEDFKAHQVPLAVCVVDMDWHITETGNDSPGWTGYSWNRQLFPDPPGFVKWLHTQGLKTALNLHPADGVYPHEQQHAEMARRLGLDPALQEPIPFDSTDSRFMQAYFEVLHHPYEQMGVDFWWLDWQQGQKTRISGLDPLWWLNHLHFYDLTRDGQKRPFIFSRWGGLGNHRYPLGFSGDTVCSWESLAFQPYFTATAANVAYGWWSHDIGGHMYGVNDPELYARWVQFGVFSPILRLHSTNNAFNERRPWGYDRQIFETVRQAMQLRHALIPYIYSQAWRCTTQSRPLVLPMYYLYPQEQEAYRCRQQYLFGSELIAAPYVSPRDPDTGVSRQSVWLPGGDWFDFFSGEHFSGGRWQVLYGGIDDFPVLAKAGAIVPLGPRVGWGGLEPPSDLDLHIFPGADNSFDLYEDDGVSQAYRDNQYALTTFHQTWLGQSLEFNIEPVQGNQELAPARRSYTITLHGLRLPERIRLWLNGAESAPSVSYDELTETLILTGLVLSPSDRLRLRLETDSPSLLSRRDRRLETCRRLLGKFNLDVRARARIDQALPDLLSGEATLDSFAAPLKDAHLNVLKSIFSRRTEE